VALLCEGRYLALRFTEDRAAAIAMLRAEWPGATVGHDSEADARIPGIFHEPDSVPLMVVGTPFQLTVWEYLRRSRNAVTMTYGEVARAIGRPSAARAVGQAVGANGIAILIPCHRVISRGKLTGYRWGLERKKALLAWELSRRDPLELPF
jgi:AraC family transcriptional regulator of adaptative response/methylated-DNA-[protein]-cysteine methyltransferase